MADPHPRYYRPDELATNLSVSRHTVYAWIRQRRIIAFRVGSLLRIPAEEYAKIMDCGVPASKKHIRGDTV